MTRNSINAAESQKYLNDIGADLLVVCDYGQILAPETLATARLGGINLHGSLLPKYRGAAPINWALLNGDTETGVTVIHMTPKVDAGPCIAQAVTAIGPEETAVELETRLAESGGWLVRRTIDALAEGRLEALPQNSALASKAPRLKKTDGTIDWSRPARASRTRFAPGTVAADLYLLASRAWRRGPHDPRAGRRRRIAPHIPSARHRP